MKQRTGMGAAALAGLAMTLVAPHEAGAVRLFEGARSDWPPPPGYVAQGLTLAAIFAPPPPSTGLPEPLAAGGLAGVSRLPEGASERWLDLGFYSQPVFTAMTGYSADARSNFSSPPSFGVQRTRLILHAQPHHLVQVRMELNIADQLTLLDTYVHVPIRRWLNVQAGQFRVPFSRQELISSARFQFADRQLWANSANSSGINFIPSFDQGLMLWGWVGPRDMFEYYVGVFNGKGPNRPANIDGYFLYAARLAVNPLGRPRVFQESAVGLPLAPTLSIGVNAFMQTRQVGFTTLTGSTTPVPNRVTARSIAGDVFFAGWGASLYGEVMFRDTQETDTMAAPSTQSLGWLVQAGYVLPIPGWRDHLEVVARVQSFDPSNCLTASFGPDCGQRPASSQSPEVYRDFMFSRAYTVGVNWYQLGHGLKLQAQYTFNTELRDVTNDPRPGSGVVDNDRFTLALTGSI